MFVYELYGLKFQSEMEIPEIFGSSVVDASEPAVSIEVSRLPRFLAGGKKMSERMQFTKTACLYRFEGIGAFLVEGGRKIVIHPDAGSQPSDIRAYLLGGVMGTLLHQRGLIPLHISAVSSPAGIIAFTGPSGAGKSTTAAKVHRTFGWPVVCDDVAVVRIVDGTPVISAGLSRLKLWKDALQRIEISFDSLPRDMSRTEKFHLSDRRMFMRDGGKLSHLVELRFDEHGSIEPLLGAEAFQSIVGAVYRPFLVDIFGSRARLNHDCALLAKAVDVWRLARKKTGDDTDIELVSSQFCPREARTV